MIRGAFRSRLLELRRELEAARAGREVLEQKRELLLRQWVEAGRRAAEARAQAASVLDLARQEVAAARAAMGTAALESAILAQPERAGAERSLKSSVGVPVEHWTVRLEPFHPAYGPLGTAPALDRAGLAWHDALSSLVVLADAESTRRALHRGLQRTARRLGALEGILLPRLRSEIREVSAALDEEERDEGLRRRRYLALRETRRD